MAETSNRPIMTVEDIIVLIKIAHTAIFLFVSACILYVLVSGITGRTRRRLIYAAAAIPALVGVSWVLNGCECPLATLVYHLSAGDRSVPDIYLPDWFSRWIMSGSTAVMAIAGMLALWRTWTDRWNGRPGTAPPRDR